MIEPLEIGVWWHLSETLSTAWQGLSYLGKSAGFECLDILQVASNTRVYPTIIEARNSQTVLDRHPWL